MLRSLSHVVDKVSLEMRKHRIDAHELVIT